MIRIKEFKIASSMDEAYESLMESPRNVILGGACFFNLQDKAVNKAIDLEEIGLDYIRDVEGDIHIGSETTLYEIEKSKLIKDHCDGILSDAISTIVGVQLRNTAKIGGSVYSKYGFSDILAPLLVLDAQVVFHNMGTIELKDYLDMDRPRDIIEKIILPKKEGKGFFHVNRKTHTDFAQLNCAILKEDGKHRIAVGARPEMAKVMDKLGAYLDENIIACNFQFPEDIKAELGLGRNLKASKDLREAILKDMLFNYSNQVGERDGEGIREKSIDG